MRRSQLWTFALSIAAFGAAATGAAAHHSAAMFDFTKTRTLTGVVSEFAWSNPHGYLQLGVTTASGRTQKWSIEFQSLVGMSRQGLKPSSFKPGDKVEVIIHPLRNGTTGGDFVSAVLADGTRIAGS
jgi:hypothetical protein